MRMLAFLLVVASASAGEIQVVPSSVDLGHLGEEAGLIVTERESGRELDRTRVAEFRSTDESVVRIEGHIVRPVGAGEATIVVRVGDSRIRVPVKVRSTLKATPSFHHDVLPVLSKAGCSSGVCHGSPHGKGGFRLSLRAYAPEVDRYTLLREFPGRRVNVLDAAGSLLLAKPTLTVAHRGGQKLRAGDRYYRTLHEWISAGARIEESEDANCVGIEVYPPPGRVLEDPERAQQLAVFARFADGRRRDVTSLAVVTSSDEDVATVTPDGLVEAGDRGEVALLVRYLDHMETTYLTFKRDVEGFAWPDPTPRNLVDEHVFEKLKTLRFTPAPAANDSEFLRRVHLDVTGLLPSVERTRRFLANDQSDKRERLIDELLASQEHHKFWALKWGDLLRASKRAIGNETLFKYQRWLEGAFAANMPYDRFAKALLGASGATDKNPAANYYRVPADVFDAMETTAQVFLGTRMQCAKCHNHPFERWTQDDYYGFATFFKGVEKKKGRDGALIIFEGRGGDVIHPRRGKPAVAWLPEVDDAEPAEGEKRRDRLLRWLTEPDNRFFARVEVNRLWAQVLGRGIVEPFDDLRDSNPPTHPELLDALAKDFVAHGFDRRRTLRLILNSRTYQTASSGGSDESRATRYFARYPARRLSAEQLLDALGQVTQVHERFRSLPAGTRATQLPAPDVAENDFLKVFGQPARQTVCECERSDDSSLAQTLLLYNGGAVHERLRNSANRFRRGLKEGRPPKDVITELFLATLSRFPNDAELTRSIEHVQSAENAEIGVEDVCWALLNRAEFLFQH